MPEHARHPGLILQLACKACSCCWIVLVDYITWFTSAVALLPLVLPSSLRSPAHHTALFGGPGRAVFCLVSTQFVKPVAFIPLSTCQREPAKSCGGVGVGPWVPVHRHTMRGRQGTAPAAQEQQHSAEAQPVYRYAFVQELMRCGAMMESDAIESFAKLTGSRDGAWRCERHMEGRYGGVVCKDATGAAPEHACCRAVLTPTAPQGICMLSQAACSPHPQPHDVTVVPLSSHAGRPDCREK